MGYMPAAAATCINKPSTAVAAFGDKCQRSDNKEPCGKLYKKFQERFCKKIHERFRENIIKCKKDHH